MIGLGPRRVAGESVSLSKSGESLRAAGDDLVGVALMTGVPENDVLGGVEDSMDGERQFDDAEVRAEMAPMSGDRLDDEIAHLPRQRLELLGGERSEIGWGSDALEDHSQGVSFAVTQERYRFRWLTDLSQGCDQCRCRRADLRSKRSPWIAHHEVGVERDGRPPMANDGAPARLTTRFTA